jgi:hypothetical protein
MDAQLHATRGDAVVSAPQYVHGLSFLTPSPKYWANRCVADYYGLHSVRTKTGGL